MNRRSLGNWGEALAERHLVDRGYVILARKFRVPEGEVDLVARHGETIVFVEVKTRSSSAFGPPEESITVQKRRRLQIVAWGYLDQHDLLESGWRIDVIAIEGTPVGGVKRLEHYLNAVDGEDTL